MLRLPGTYPVQPVYTSLLFILLFIMSQYTVFAHLICCALFILLHILFLFFTYIYALVLCYFYIIFIFILLHCPLSGPDLIYISLLIIPCIIYYVTNKETLNLEPWLYKCWWCHYCCGHIPLVFMQWNQHFKKHQQIKINKYILNAF